MAHANSCAAHHASMAGSHVDLCGLE